MRGGQVAREVKTRAKHNLPTQITPLIGREQDIRDVQRLLRESRLVTLAGAGGIGKTRLALEVSSRAVDRYADGVWFVELAPVGDASFVLQAIASALGVLEEVGRPLIESVNRRLRAATCLLVLDNCEHLIAGTASLTEQLLAASTGLQVLATSREPLGVRGEVILRVRPLTLPRAGTSRYRERSASERLFLARVAAVQPRFDGAEEHADTVRQICRRLDGIPLAIELAAACITFLSPADLLARLEHSPGFLRTAERTAPARHRTMSAAIQWSYDLMTADERRLFERLAVFVGGFSLEAVESVCGLGDRSLDLVGRLVSKSLLVFEAGQPGGVDYRLLEPLRDFGLHKLRDARQEHDIRRRHAAFYRALAQQSNLVMQTGAGGRWLDPLAWHHDNMHAALRWLLENGEVQDAQLVGTAVAEAWRQRGHLGEARSLLAHLLSLSSANEPTPARAGLLLLAGQLACFQGDIPSARVLLGQCIALCRTLGLPAGLARALFRLADVERAQGRYDIARALVADSVRSAPPADGPGSGGLAAGARCWECLVDLDEGKVEVATELAAALLPGFEAGGWTRNAAQAQMILGACAAERGELAAAQAYLEQSLARSQASDRWGAARALVELARLALTGGDVESAAARLAESLTLSRDLGDPWSTAAGLDVRAALAARSGHAARAVRFAEAAATVRDRVQFVQPPRERAWLEAQLGAAHRSLPRAAYAAERAAGRTLTLEQIMQLALENEPDERPTALTPRERDVARLLARGWTDAQIAEALVIARRTAEVHVRNILAKLSFTSRAQIAVWAVDHGLREPEAAIAQAEGESAGPVYVTSRMRASNSRV